MELSSSNITKILIFSLRKAFLIFSQKKAFLLFPEVESCTFQSKIEKQKNSTTRKFCILQETKTLTKFLVFFKKKATLMFGESETLKKLLFQDVTYKA